jgi:putative ABC transport system permease protein
VAGATSLLDALGFRPPAIARPETLVRIQAASPTGPSDRLSYPDFEDLRARSRAFDGLAAYGTKAAGLSGAEAPPEVVVIGVTTPEYFGILGVAASRGRLFGSGDDAPDRQSAVVISDALWRRRFHQDPDVVQRTMTVNGGTCGILGVAPRGFSGLEPYLVPDVWIPFATWARLMSGGRPSAELTDRESRWIRVVGRLHQAVTWRDRLLDLVGRPVPALAPAEHDLVAVAAGVRADTPRVSPDFRLTVVTDTRARRGRLLPLALMLMFVAALVVTIGCANVAGLLAGRAESRRTEIAMRAALGATRPRLVRELLAESVLLAAGAVGPGLLLGWLAVRLMPALLPLMSLPLGFEFRADGRFVLVTAVAAVLTIVLSGLWPAMVGSRADLYGAARPSGAGIGQRFRGCLVIGQVAVSVVLLIIGGLLVRGVQASQAVDRGFALQPLLLVPIAPAAAGYDGPRSAVFFRTLVERLAGAPGVGRVSMARRVPLDPNGGGAARDLVVPRGGSDGAPLRVRFNSVLPNYFDVMGTRIFSGRAFRDGDGPGAPGVVIVNQALARLSWPGESAIGRTVRISGAGAGTYEVVGVAEDGKYLSLAESPQPYLYFPLAQSPTAELTLIVQPARDQATAAAAVQDVLREIDPRMPTMRILTLAEQVRFASYETRLAALVVGILGISGALLSVVGLYGVIAFLVARRTREIGIRIALGAGRRDVCRLVAGSSLALSVSGAAVGVALALLLSRALAHSLYGVSPADPLVYASVTFGVVVVTIAAAAGPVRRALRVEPVAALRAD